jgi:hypothetical protein
MPLAAKWLRCPAPFRFWRSIANPSPHLTLRREVKLWRQLTDPINTREIQPGTQIRVNLRPFAVDSFRRVFAFLAIFCGYS